MFRLYGMDVGGGGYSFRGYYILCPEGVVRARVVADLPVALHAQHILKQVPNFDSHQQFKKKLKKAFLSANVLAKHWPLEIRNQYSDQTTHRNRWRIWLEPGGLE